MDLPTDTPADEANDDWGLRRPPQDYVEAIYHLEITRSVARDVLANYKNLVAESARDAVVVARLAARDLLPRDRRERRARALAARQDHLDRARLAYLYARGVQS